MLQIEGRDIQARQAEVVPKDNQDCNKTKDIQVNNRFQKEQKKEISLILRENVAPT